MEFIARTHLRIQGLDGVLKTVEPGAPLPEFRTWPYVLRQAHLDNGTVEQVGGQYEANLDYSGGYVSMGPKTPVAPRDLDTSTLVATEPLPEPVDEVKGYPCHLCDKSFARPSRLSKHIENNH